MAGYNVAPLENLAEQFEKMPGIGYKTAQRLAYYVLNMPKKEAEAFSSAIIEAHEKIHYCKVCCNLTDKELCPVCSNEKRDKSLICVVETPRDAVAMEATNEYKGTYHVLHGAISPLNDIGPDDLRIKELLARLSGDVSEVEYTVSANGEYINVETDRLSEFAFLVEKTTDGGKGTVSTRHGFCVGWVVFIFVMLELLYLALYVLLWLPKAAFIVKKCKLSALDDFRKGHILFGRVDLLHFIGLCFSGAVFIFALVALCVHVCPVTIVCLVFALLIFAAFLFFI